MRPNYRRYVNKVRTLEKGFIFDLMKCSQLLRGKPTKHSDEIIKNISTQASEHLNLDYRVKLL